MLHFAPESRGIGVTPNRTLLRFRRWSPRRQSGKVFPRCFHGVPILKQLDSASSVVEFQCTSGCGPCVRIETEAGAGNANEIG